MQIKHKGKSDKIFKPNSIPIHPSHGDSQSHGCLVALIAWLIYVWSLDDVWMLYGCLVSMDARLVVRKAITMGWMDRNGVGFENFIRFTFMLYLHC